MNQESVWRDFSKLPPEAQQEVIDFIAFLQARKFPVRPRKKTKVSSLAQEAFIGMWQNRNDLQDSTQWVRGLRGSEWGKP